MSLRRVLVANRGEIAVRIIRACREAGLESVAVYSDADAAALHARLADRALRIGPEAASESYLSIAALIAAARESGADAVHPGYGFLAERPDFARACEEAGLAFIGPPADVVERVGSKIDARRLMQQAGVPVVPGVAPGEQSLEGLMAAAREVGYPVLVKASAGGGGKGMRVLHAEAEAADALPAARREAAAAFGDGTLYIERLIERPRHVEIQVLADHHGNVVQLFERECSLQRRHQKIIEESPSPGITPAVRKRMAAAAVDAARAAGYRNAGTIEFLVEGRGDHARFYFLEMNTRLQVEHPITECVTGLDLVRAQFRIAAGEPLPWRQSELSPRGHAIECRIYAEDPDNDFLPQAGTLALYREPSGPGVRVDSGVVQGDEVDVRYDPLLAKLIVAGETREAAIARTAAALREYPVLGIRTNIPFLLRVVEHEAFRSGDIHIGFVRQHLADLITRDDVPAAALAAAAFGASTAKVRLPSPDVLDPWTTLRGWGRGA